SSSRVRILASRPLPARLSAPAGLGAEGSRGSTIPGSRLASGTGPRLWAERRRGAERTGDPGRAAGGSVSPSRPPGPHTGALSLCRCHDDFLQCVGSTPIVRLNRVARGVPPEVLAKCEFLTPGGSVKDRIGVHMLEQAEARGEIRPGDTLIEATS